MRLAYVKELKKIGKVVDYTSSLIGGKYLIEIDGSQISYKSSGITPLDKEFSNKDLWKLAESKSLPEGAEFKNNRGISVRLTHDKLVPTAANPLLRIDELYMHNDGWLYQKV
ncbi:MAG TPA: hypothetical protein VIK72_05400 [Clostridiaceae bacterium]